MHCELPEKKDEQEVEIAITFDSQMKVVIKIFNKEELNCKYWILLISGCVYIGRLHGITVEEIEKAYLKKLKEY